MKKIFTLLVIALFAQATWAQNADYLLKKDFQSEKKKISEGIESAKKVGIDAKRIATKQSNIFDSIAKSLAANEKALKQNNDSLQNTTAQFNNLKARVSRIATKTKFYLRLLLVLMVVGFIILLILPFFLKKKSDIKIEKLIEENKKFSESMKQELALMKEELEKGSDLLAMKLQENSAHTASKFEQYEKKQSDFTRKLEETIDEVVKEQTLQKSMVEEKFNNVLLKVNTEKADHLDLHNKIESEVKGLKALHEKDIEEIKAKL